MERKAVIDSDNQFILEYFDEKDTEKVLDKYKNDGRWEDVGVDIGGDIILWEDL